MSKSKARTISAGSSRSTPIKPKPDKAQAQALEETAPAAAAAPMDAPKKDFEAGRAEKFQTMRRNVAEGPDKTPAATPVAAAPPAEATAGRAPAGDPPAPPAAAPTARAPVTPQSGTRPAGPAAPPTKEPVTAASQGKPAAVFAPAPAWSPDDIFEPAADIDKTRPSLNPNPALASALWTPRAPQASGPGGYAANVSTKLSVDAGRVPAAHADREKGSIAAMRNPAPAVGYPPPPRPLGSAAASRRPGDSVWGDAWRDSPSVEQTLTRLTDALSRDQRTAAQARLHAQTARKKERRVRRSVSRVAAVSCVALLAGLSGLAVSYGWRSDGLGISAMLSSLAPVADSWQAAAPPQPAAAVALEMVEPELAEPVTSTPPATPAETAEAERRKTVATAKLVVADASGEALHYIPLSITANSTSGTDKFSIKLSGLPRETVLTSGEDLGNGSWLLKPGEERDLKLAVQTDAPRDIVIGVEAIEVQTGELAAPPQDLRVKVLPPRLFVQPAADTIRPAAVAPAAESPAVESPPVMAAAAPDLPAPAIEDGPPAPVVVKPVAIEPAAAPQVQAKIADVEPTVAPQPEVPQPAVKVAVVNPVVVATVTPSTPAAPAAAHSGDASLISRGDSLMAMGEIIGARGFYHRAYNRGDQTAARSIGRTFDPIVYAELHVMGLQPSADKALEWYRKAAAAGVSGAKSDIAALEKFLADDR